MQSDPEGNLKPEKIDAFSAEKYSIAQCKVALFSADF